MYSIFGALLRMGSAATRLKDPSGDQDWGINAVIDLAASDEAGYPVVAVTSVGGP